MSGDRSPETGTEARRAATCVSRSWNRHLGMLQPGNTELRRGRVATGGAGIAGASDGRYYNRCHREHRRSAAVLQIFLWWKDNEVASFAGTGPYFCYYLLLILLEPARNLLLPYFDFR